MGKVGSMFQFGKRLGTPRLFKTGVTGRRVCKGNNILDTQEWLCENLGIMKHTLELPKTLQQAVTFFSDPQKTFDYAVMLRWPDGKFTCPRCEGKEHSFISTRRIWYCKGCKKQFTVKV